MRLLEHWEACRIVRINTAHISGLFLRAMDMRIMLFRVLELELTTRVRLKPQAQQAMATEVQRAEPLPICTTTMGTVGKSAFLHIQQQKQVVL